MYQYAQRNRWLASCPIGERHAPNKPPASGILLRGCAKAPHFSVRNFQGCIQDKPCDEYYSYCRVYVAKVWIDVCEDFDVRVGFRWRGGPAMAIAGADNVAVRTLLGSAAAVC
jgi:hypothetical protein